MAAEINDDTMKLYIGGINPAWTNDVIKNLLQKHSSTDIMRVDVVKNFAFAFVGSKEAGQKVIEKVDGSTIEGHKLLIQVSKNKQNLPDSEDLCFECGKSGHWAKECAKRRARVGSRRPRWGHEGGYAYGSYTPGGREREAYGAYGGMDAYTRDYYAWDPYYRDPYGYPMPRYGYDYGRYQGADPYGQGPSGAPPRYGGGY